jgi:hypothetical protein
MIKPEILVLPEEVLPACLPVCLLPSPAAIIIKLSVNCAILSCPLKIDAQAQNLSLSFYVAAASIKTSAS